MVVRHMVITIVIHRLWFEMFSVITASTLLTLLYRARKCNICQQTFEKVHNLIMRHVSVLQVCFVRFKALCYTSVKKATFCI
jgi:hypothetical protein